MEKLTQKEKHNKKQYIMEFWPPMIFYMIWVFVIPELLDMLGDGWWTIPITLTQIIPLLFVLRAMLRFVENCDELMKLVFMKSAVYSLIIFTFLCMGYGFLEFRGYPSIPLFLIGTGVIPIFFIAAMVIRKMLDGK